MGGARCAGHLVQVERLDPPRYRLLETVRMYASEQLARHDETVDALRRHGDAMSRLADEADQAFWVSADATWWARYAPDMDDIEDGFWRACERRDANVATATAVLTAKRTAPTVKTMEIPRRASQERSSCSS